MFSAAKIGRFSLPCIIKNEPFFVKNDTSPDDRLNHRGLSRLLIRYASAKAAASASAMISSRDFSLWEMSERSKSSSLGICLFVSS